jgi:hypothetical protein
VAAAPLNLGVRGGPLTGGVVPAVASSRQLILVVAPGFQLPVYPVGYAVERIDLRGTIEMDSAFRNTLCA